MAGSYVFDNSCNGGPAPGIGPVTDAAGPIVGLTGNDPSLRHDDIRESLDAILAAPDLDTIWRELTGQAARFGFDRLLYGLARFLSPQYLGELEDMLVLSNHPQAYLDGFLNTGLFREAPMVVWSRDHTGAQSWRLAQERIASDTATEAELRVTEFNARFGVTAGYSLGFHDLPGRGKAGLGFCAREGLDQDAVDAIWALHGADLALLAHVAHLRIVTLAELTVGRPLSPRQREVLQWVAVGKSVQDVATILGLTLPTVEKHLRLARQALRVDTTAQAVVKATILNQILNDRRTALGDWLT